MDTEAPDTADAARRSATVLADLRAWRAGIARRPLHPLTYELMLEEIDLLLAIADERDALRRELCGEPDAPTPVRVDTLPAGHALIGGEVVPLPGAAPIVRGTLPYCDCGSVDKYGDDIGEHGPRCPYHLAVLRLAPVMDAGALDELCKRTLRAMSNA